MNYLEAQNYMEEKGRLGIVPGLTQVKELLRRLGNPQDVCRTLHIAGTNGKGSIFAFVQESLLAAGYHVGRYISPTILTYLERYQMDRCYMSEEKFAALLTEVAAVIETMETEGFASPTAFEIETAVAFLYFARNHVDYVLLECGMGGREDATNVLAKPEVCVFAQISMDHMQFLGDTLTKIATEKAGIIKPYTTVISAPQVPEVSKVLRETCEAQHASYIEVTPSDWEVVQMNLDGTDLVDGREKTDGVNRDADSGERQQPYHIPLLGEHQVANAQTAITVLRTLYIEETAIHNGIAQTTWPGRMTRVAEHPSIYVDGAHNAAAWEYLRTSVEKYFTNCRVIYIIGVLKDKEYGKMVEILAPTMAAAVVITPDTPRGLPKEILASLLQAKGVPVQLADTSAEALQKARKQADETDVILVSGSLSFLAEYLQLESGDERHGASK